MSIRKRTWKSSGAEHSAWVVDYFDQAGKRRLKTFVTKKEADAWAVTARHEVKQGVHTPASASITVAEAFARWIADCEANGLEYGTLLQRRQHLKLHIAQFIGREKLSTLTMPRGHQFDAELRGAGRSLAMRRKVITNLKTVLTFAQGAGARGAERGARHEGERRYPFKARQAQGGRGLPEPSRNTRVARRRARALAGILRSGRLYCGRPNCVDCVGWTLNLAPVS